MAEVVLKNVTKIFDKDIIAVKDTSIQVEDKEFVILVGPSGCGKSTILRMIAGLEEITQGQILIDGKLINAIPPKDRDIAMVFQNYALYPHMSVFGNMAFGLKLRKIPKQEIHNRVHDAAEILGIQNLLDRKPKELSGGQRQRVAVGRAIVRKPKVFLFDEPLSNLDAKLRVQMRIEISKLHQRLKATMIYVTHDQVEAITMGDRIVVLRDGIVNQIDNPLNLYNRPKNKFVAGFIGSPPMNFLKGKIIKKNGIWIDAGKLKLKFPVQYEKRLERYIKKDVTFGIRPEDIVELGKVSGITDIAKAKLQIEVVEPMGNEIILYTLTGHHSIVVRLGAQFQAESGQAIELAFNMNKCHLFDSKTEDSINLR